MKNGDAIRSMTDEELARFLSPYCMSASWECPQHHEVRCIDCWRGWLKEEAKVAWEKFVKEHG